MRHARSTTAVAILLVQVLGCRQPDYDAAKGQFQKENAGCTALSAEPGEGNSDHVYVRIRYRCHGSHIQEAQWLYQRAGGQWRRTAIVFGPPAARPANDVARAVLPSMPRSEPLPVGGAVTAPVILHRVDPKFPEVVRNQTTLLFEATIAKNGDVVGLHLLKGKSDAYAQAAQDAIRQWRFKPGTYRGQPVDVRYNLSVTIRGR